ncbi:hypothetical protein M9C82_01040 [SAR86 cluster bacterium]|nr:hypothetical protein M9C82_01040 [SAR86 cluster bacterium]
MPKITQETLFDAISKALDVDSSKVNLDSSIDTIEEWDSLGSLSILTSLDELSDGETSKIEDISSAASCKDIIDLLKVHNLYDPS